MFVAFQPSLRRIALELARLGHWLWPYYKLYVTKSVQSEMFARDWRLDAGIGITRGVDIRPVVSGRIGPHVFDNRPLGRSIAAYS